MLKHTDSNMWDAPNSVSTANCVVENSWALSKDTGTTLRQVYERN